VWQEGSADEATLVFITHRAQEGAFQKTAMAVEDLGVSAYAGQGPRLKQVPVIQAALAIHSVEARHAAWIRSILGGKHPQAMGQPAAEVWREIWEDVGPRAASTLEGNEGTYDEALLLIMERNGYPEETYYTFSYSPVPDDEGRPNGIFCANTDDTQRIVGERQMGLLRELAARTGDARTVDDACALSTPAIESHTPDLPFPISHQTDTDE